MSTYFVQKEGQKWGPFTTEELEEKVGEGAFSPEDLFWTEGMEEWEPLCEILEVVEEPEVEDGQEEPEASPIFEIEETHILFDSPEARLTSSVLHLIGEDIPVHALAKASVQTETIHRAKPIVGSVLLGVAIICVAFIEVHRPTLTAWFLWGAVLVVLLIWWLRMFSVAIRSAATMLIVDLRNGDERLLRMEAPEAHDLAATINQAVIDAVER